ncbi:MAG: HDOD domain-containing protein [Verrucomicrobiota bacterium]
MKNLDQEFLDQLFPMEKVQPDFRGKLLDILQHDPEFPTFPAAIARIREAMNRPDASFEEIAKLVKLDPGLTARLFTLVKSAAFAGVEVSNVEDALFRLGLKETRSAVLATKFMTSFAHLRVRVDWNKFWLHSLLTARLTQGIADLFQPVSDREYLSGLMHDIGKIIVAHYFPDTFEAVLKEARQFGCAMFQAEQRVLGTDHASVGMALCCRWGLYDEVQQAILFHHAPEQPHNAAFITRCLHIADTIANLASENIEESRFKPAPPEKIDEFPLWQLLKDYTPRRMINISIEDECAKAQDSLQVMLTPQS